MNELLSEPVLSRLVGVTDLRRGRAVHAIAGQREDYCDVACCSGDATELARQYIALGVSYCYIADLDAIGSDPIQTSLLDRLLCEYDGDVVGGIVDIGWTGHQSDDDRRAIEELARKHPHVQWVAATESIDGIDSLTRLADLVDAQRVLLGLDFRGGNLISRNASFDDASWVDAACALKCAGAVVLDIASVGTSSGPTSLEICRRTRRRAPNWTIYSGGGVRTAPDVKEFLSAGCDRCLVGTALHRLCPTGTPQRK